MSLSLDIDCLRKNELLYEIKVKGQDVSDDVTVDELKKILRALKGTVDKEFSKKYLSSLDPSDELKVCSEKYIEVLNANHVSCFKKCRTLLNHIILRLDRLIISNEDQRLTKINLLTDTYTLLRNLKCGLAGTSASTVTDAPPRVDHHENTASPVTSKHFLGLLLKLNLHFDGEGPVHDFVSKLEDFINFSKIPPAEFLENISYVLSGEALVWYKSVKEQISSAHQFIDLIKIEFQSVESERSLLNQIKTRLQQPNEKIRTFINIMRYLFTRLVEPLPESEQLQIIMTNMSPFYISRLSLTEVSSIDHLKQLCLKLEVAKHRCEHRGYLNPGSDVIISELTPPKANLKTKSSLNTVALKCLKCDGSHHYRDCQTYVGIHCFKCKKPGTLSRDCSCSKNLEIGQK